MINVMSSVVAVSHLENRAVIFAVRRLPGREVSEHFCDCQGTLSGVCISIEFCERILPLRMEEDPISHLHVLGI